MTEPPLARRARELDLEVALVESVKDDEFLRRLRKLDPWVGVVVAFGQIFPRTLLELPARGCVNLHASLLPRHRGAAPIQAAIAAGETTTGVTSMKMAAGLDAGPILLQEELAIDEEETAPELSKRLAAAGAALMVRTLRSLAEGTLAQVAQDDSLATLAPKLSRENGEVDWQMTAREIFNRWRAYTPWPGLTALLRGEAIKIRRCSPSSELERGAEAGTIVSVEPQLRVACGDGSSLLLEALQRPNRGVLEAQEFVNGEHLEPGERFEVVPLS
jgi:methionyl-tRNA formyltransferase